MERQEVPTWHLDQRPGPDRRPIDAQLDGRRDQYATPLRGRPYALDDATLDGLLRTYGDTAG